MEWMIMVKGVDMNIKMCGYVWTCPHREWSPSHCKCGVHIKM